MKKNIPCRLATFGTALILSALTTFPAFAAAYSGHLDTVTETSITGWAWDSDSPSSAVSVELTITGETTEPSAVTVISVSADQFRDDLNTVLGSGAHGFAYTIDWSGYAAGTYTVTASAVSGDTKIPLIGSITYKKEDAPAAVLPTPAVVVPEMIPASVQPETTVSAEPAVSTPVPAGPGSSASSKPSAGPGFGLTQDQIAIGPGFANGKSKNTYGPGASSYVTGEPDQYLGSFHATAYCNCERCSGGHALTYSGTVPKPNHTIAADLIKYPIGTKLLINGIVYTVEDKGSNVIDDRIDIFFATHEEALAFGTKNVDVYSVK